MRRLTCADCGSDFYPVSEDWGDRTCGDCIASRIELSLFPLAVREARKPMRRATDHEALPRTSYIDELRKAG